MKKIILLLPLVLFLAFAEFKFISSEYSSSGNKLAEVIIKGRKFKVEIAETETKKHLGLGKRENLCSSCGMLFIFEDSGKHRFWMKEMKFPLDIIWISKNEIVHIERNVSENYKEIISPLKDADKVLEINAGLCEKYGIGIGDEAVLKMR